MKVAAVAFPMPPPAGTVLVMADGQSFRLERVEPYTRRDGRESAVLVWSSVCPESGEVFEQKTGLAFGLQFNRRAPGHHKPGCRVVPLRPSAPPLPRARQGRVPRGDRIVTSQGGAAACGASPGRASP